MKRFFTSALIMCGLCMTLAAQGTSVLEQLCAKMAGSATVMSYGYTLTVSGVKNVGNGVLTTQDKSYLMQGNVMKIYCNASTLWVVDEGGKEIMIDGVSQESDAYMSNPALLLADVSSVFSVSSPISNGAKLTYRLTPKSDCGIASGTIILDTTNPLPVFVSASFKLTDGSQLDVKIKSMTLTEKKPLTFYTLDLSEFDSSWMITDLR